MSSAHAESLSATAAPAGGDTAPLLLRRDEGGGILSLTLNRPKSRNSLSLAMLDALQAAFAAIAADPAVRVVILAAEGPVYSAGHDLREITAHRADPDGGHGFFDTAMTRCAEVMQAIVALPQPVIAAVQGTATAAGCQLVATCDLAPLPNILFGDGPFTLYYRWGAALGGLDHRQADAVLHRAERVEEFQLRRDGGGAAGGDPVEPQQRRVADQRGDVGRDAHAGALPSWLSRCPRARSRGCARAPRPSARGP